jgi:hypothetical protein
MNLFGETIEKRIINPDLDAGERSDRARSDGEDRGSSSFSSSFYSRPVTSSFFGWLSTFRLYCRAISSLVGSCFFCQ